MKVGIIGGGQLGMMLAEAAKSLGVETVCLEPKENCPASYVTQTIQAEYNDTNALNQLASICDVITYEFENVPVETLKEITKTPIFPDINALATSQDRLKEKMLFNELNIPTTHYAAVASINEAKENALKIGFPCILKTRRLGYDGKGQAIIKHENDIEPAFNLLKSDEVILENMISLDAETSIIAARNEDGDIKFYPLIKNSHKNGILDTSVSPCKNSEFQKKAEAYAKRVLEKFNYVGVLTIEFFISSGKLIANEMAPRVHNSGHLTIEGSKTSQFENHIRAITNMALGSTEKKSFALMKNIIGKLPNTKKIISEFKNAKIHLYNKSERPSRKIGHITITCKDEDDIKNNIEKIKKHVKADY